MSLPKVVFSIQTNNLHTEWVFKANLKTQMWKMMHLLHFYHLEPPLCSPFNDLFRWRGTRWLNTEVCLGMNHGFSIFKNTLLPTAFSAIST